MSDVPPFNQIAVEPELIDVLNMFKRNIFLSLNCHAIGRIESFDANFQTCTATVSYKKLLAKNNKFVNEDYPILIDCPVVILGGGSANLTFPISPGDECLILFNDRDIDNWLNGNPPQAPASNRAHSMSDAIVLVGLKSLESSIDDYDTTRAMLKNGQAYVGVSTSKVKIANNLTTLNTLLQNLCTQLEALTVICASPGNPSSVPVNAAAISAIATQIGSLLE